MSAFVVKFLGEDEYAWHWSASLSDSAGVGETTFELMPGTIGGAWTETIGRSLLILSAA